MTHLDIPGWCDFEDGYSEAVNHFSRGTFVEVGCYLGRSLCHLGELVKASGKPIRVIGVEWGLGSGPELQATGPGGFHAEALAAGGGTLIGQLHRNIIACGLQDVVEIIVSSSQRASTLFKDFSLQMVFLDAAHDYENVKADIEAWRPKVDSGGWLGGDDLTTIWPGVRRAVEEKFVSGYHNGGWEPWSHDSWRVKI
jgi:hypothetical protein